MNFLTILLLIALVLSIAIIVQQQRYRKRLIRTTTTLVFDLGAENRHLKTCLEAVDLNYKALETGQQEIIDNYENDFLDLRAQVGAANAAAAYDREVREETERKLAQWDEVIRKHADHCDSILTEMVEVIMHEFNPKAPIMEVHNHSSEEGCDENECTADRYVDGMHVFTDKTLETSPADE